MTEANQSHDRRKTTLYRVRLLGAQTMDARVVGYVEFSPAILPREADALLNCSAPSLELFSFQGPKAWYQEEPLTMSHLRTPDARRALAELRPDEFFHHSNPDPYYRVLNPTHIGSLTKHRSATRRDRAVAVVSNHGGRVWWLRRGPRIRNHFILHPSVDLYGHEASWRRFRKFPWSRAAKPPNYRGPVENAWYEPSQVEFLAEYKVVVCMENSFASPYYFTEKFVNAARAGCIPVFHAIPSVRKSRMAGARWVDPADFGFDPDKTIRFALEQSLEEYQRTNDAWLDTPGVAATERNVIWQRVADLMREKIIAYRQTAGQTAGKS